MKTRLRIVTLSIAAALGACSDKAVEDRKDPSKPGGPEAGVYEDATVDPIDAGSKPASDASVPINDSGPEQEDAALPDAEVPPPSEGIKTFERVCSASVSLQITVYSDDLVRFRFLPGVSAPPERGWLYDLSGFSGPQAFALEQDDASVLAFKTKALRFRVDETCKPEITDLSGRVLWKTFDAFSSDGKTASISRTLPTLERIYGLGEKTGAGNRRGRRLTNWNSDPAWILPEKRYTPTTDPIYQSHPFYLSVNEGKSAGAYLASSFRSVFDLGATKTDRVTIQVDDETIDLFVFAGPTPQDVVATYTKLVGRSPLPPRYSLGFHQARWSYTPDARVRTIANEFRTRKLPADAVWLDIDYMDGYRSFTFHPENFATPKALTAELGALGFRTITILDPGIKYDPGAGYGAYDRGVAANAFIKDAQGALVQRKCWPEWAVFPDFSGKPGRDYWASEVSQFLTTSGVSALWIDMNEPAVFHEEGFSNEAPVDGEGTSTTFAEIRNLYGSLMAQATYAGSIAARPEERPFILTRAGFSGVQKYAAVWTGDAESTWETVAMLPAQLVGMSVSGIAMVGSDVGGFTGAQSPEMYGRWFEIGTFSPFFRGHVMKEKDGKATPDQEPWSFGTEIESAAQKLLALRYSLIPYWEQQLIAHERDGTPVLRPVWWDAPSDPQSLVREDEWWVGPSLLVAPVTKAGVTTHEVYLPPGHFIDFHTGALLDGGKTITTQAPIGRVPMYVRAGAIMPMQSAREHTDQAAPADTRFIDVFAGADGNTELHEDDGKSFAYRKDGFARTRVSVQTNNESTTIALEARSGAYVPKTRTLGVRLHGVGNGSATLDAKAAETTWDGATRTIAVTLPDDGMAHRVVFTHAAPTPGDSEIAVELEVTLPAGTPDGPIYVAGDTFGWMPNGLALTRANATLATGTWKLKKGTTAAFKFTRGAWPSVEKTAACGEVENRALSIPSDQDQPIKLALSIATWSDLCSP
jgi:alpha-glucosidase